MNLFSENIQFANSEFLWLLLIIPLLIIWQIFQGKKNNPNLKFSSSEGFEKLKPTIKQRLRHILPVMRLITLSLIIVILARPQSSSSKRSINSEGIDIVIAMDVSSSMLAQDFKPNRLEAAKEKAIEFVDDRLNDRIGLAIFAGEAFTQSPITIDHNVIRNLISEIETGRIKDGTAIGDGLAVAVNRLKDSKADSKVAILLTDGVSNTGFLSPETAAELAITYGIKVYSIGVGTMGKAPYPATDPFGRERVINVDVEIDEEILTSISEKTGGQYFRATDNKSLENIYKTIDELEKTEIEVSYFNDYSEEFINLAIIAGAIFFLELFFRYTFLRTVLWYGNVNSNQNQNIANARS